MAEPTSMDDILSEKEPEKVVEKPVEAEPSEAELTQSVEEKAAAAEAKKREYESVKRQAQRKEWEAQGRDPDTGQFIKKEKDEETKKAEKPEKPVEKPAEKLVEEMTAKEKAAFAKAADETRKRQVLEQRLRELEAKQQQPPGEDHKTFWDDPEGHLEKQKQELRQAILSTRIQTSEAIAKSRHTDFDEKSAIFMELVKTVPSLVHQMLAAPDPAEFAYQTAKTHKELQEAGGIDALRKKIESETKATVRAEIEAELKVKAEALEKERAALPGSLTDSPSKGVNRPVWGGPTPMDDILKI